MKKWIQRIDQRTLFWMIFLLGVGVRLWRFGRVPEGISQDEALSGYIAYSLLETGCDQLGYPYPVYLTAWGNGMNALNSYLMIPLMALFGLEVWVVRLPQLLVGCLTMVSVYHLGKMLRGKTLGLWAMFLVTIAPWHIMLSRWGLESNLAPGFLLMGMTCFVAAIQKGSKWFVPCGLCYGLSLYAYATVWLYVPAALLLMGLYAVLCGKLRIDRWLILGCLLLGLLALPLLLFLLINNGYLEEIVLPFFSIPKMLAYRGNEIWCRSFDTWMETLNKTLIKQEDEYFWNHAGGYGLYYPFALPLWIMGIAYTVIDVLKAGKKGDDRGFVLMNLIVALGLSRFLTVNINTFNCVHLLILLMAAYGVDRLCAKRSQIVRLIPVTVYLAAFAGFVHYYFIADNAPRFRARFPRAIDYAFDMDGTIYTMYGSVYPIVLFQTAYDPVQFREEVVYAEYPAECVYPKELGRIRFMEKMPSAEDTSWLDEEGIYLMSEYEFSYDFFYEIGWEVEHFDIFYVAWAPQIAEQ